MSNFGAVPTAILSAVDTALTLGGYRDGFISYAKIPTDKFPYAMIYDPAKEIERGEFRHGSETTVNPLIVVWKSVAIATVNAGVVSVEAQIASDPTLGGVVEDAWVASVGRDEGLDSEYTAALFVIETRGSV